MLTIRPPRLASISRLATSVASSHGPRRLVSSTASTSSSDILCARWASGMPALLTRMVTSPTSASAVSSAAMICAGVGDVERDRHRTCRRAALISAGDLVEPVDPPGRRRPRVAPAAARVMAKRRPRPELAPVTSATWPVRSVEAYGSGNEVSVMDPLLSGSCQSTDPSTTRGPASARPSPRG